LLFSDKSSIKQKTLDPVWNETFIHEVENVNELAIVVFHKAPLDDVFNANATISFDDLIARNEQEQTDFWVDLEPSGRLHVKIDLRWPKGEEKLYFLFSGLLWNLLGENQRKFK
jgi:novel protein kinase C epsilon type